MSPNDEWCAECSEYHDPRLHTPGGDITDLDPPPADAVPDTNDMTEAELARRWSKP